MFSFLQFGTDDDQSQTNGSTNRLRRLDRVADVKHVFVEPPEAKPPKSIAKKKPNLWKRSKENPALAVDVVSRILFPSIFIVFNIFYWCWYKLPQDDEEELEA